MERKIDWKLFVIGSGYVAGAVLDLLSAVASLIYMLAPNETFVHQMFGWPVVSEISYMILITECALMFGWTALLVWGLLKPIERRGVLLLTVVPVVSMIVIFNIVAIVQGNVFWSIGRLLPPAIVIILLIIGYILAHLTAKKQVKVDEVATS